MVAQQKQQCVSPPAVMSPLSAVYTSREKNKLSSHSMHSPARSNTIHMQSQKEPLHVPDDLLLASTSSSSIVMPIYISTIPTSSTTIMSSPNCNQIALSPEYFYRNTESTIRLSPTMQNNTQSQCLPKSEYLRRATSSVSANSTSAPISPNRNHNNNYNSSSNNNYINSNINTNNNNNNKGNANNTMLARSPQFSSNYNNLLSPNYSGNNNDSIAIRMESPKNLTVIQQAKFQPYKEVSKPFEMSDFYKYSTKFRGTTGAGVATNINTIRQPHQTDTQKNLY